MKRVEYFERAQSMYIEGGMTYREISVQLGIAEKTVQQWAAEGKWREKRAELTEQKTSLDDRLYRFVNKLMTNVEKDLDAGCPIDPGRMFALTRLVDKLDKARKFESEKKQATQALEDQAKQASAEEVEKKVQELLGITG
jgi:predicted transcriptional regulator